MRARAGTPLVTGRSRSGPAVDAVGRAHAVAAIAAALDALITIDHRGRVLELNTAAEETFGYSREEALGRELTELIVPAGAREAHRRGLARWTADGPANGAGQILDTRIEMIAQNADGEEFPVEIAICRLAVEGPPLFTAWIRDTRERELSENRLRDAESRYRVLVEQLPLVVYVDAIDAVSSNLYTSPQVEPLLGYAPDDWRADPDLFVRLLHPDDRERVLAAHAGAHAGDPLSIEYRLVARDGRIVWVHDEARAIADPTGAPVALQGYLLDITAAKEAEEQLRYQAFHDPLTGLPNRTLFKDRVVAALAAGDGAEAAMLLLDIDDFKAINDRFGHLDADALLRDIGTRLRDALPESVVVARLGGDEFAALLDPAHDPARIAVRSAGALIDALRAPFQVAGVEVFLTTSVGIALGSGVDELLRHADVAMYRAKSAGKAQYALYAPWMDAAVLGRLELLGELRQARLDEDFVLHYQPVLDLATGLVVGVEALLRWRHPTRGIVQPGEFIPIAEESGLIVPVGRWVLEQACRQVAHWRDSCPDGKGLTVSVNVSARQLQHPDFVHDVRVALDAAALDPRTLVLEITEGVVIGDRAAVGEMLEALRLMGVGLALDDFGIGYSSLSLLETLPFDALKLDRAFVSRLGASGSPAPLVRAIADLGAALELEVIAEGIENEGQVAELRRLGVRRGQGSYFSVPVEPPQIDQLVRDGLRTRPYAA